LIKIHIVIFINLITIKSGKTQKAHIAIAKEYLKEPVDMAGKSLERTYKSKC